MVGDICKSAEMVMAVSAGLVFVKRHILVVIKPHPELFHIGLYRGLPPAAQAAEARNSELTKIPVTFFIMLLSF